MPMSDIIFLGCFQAFIFLSCFAVCYYKKQNPRLVLIFNLYKTLSLRHLATGFYRIIHKISIQYTYIPVIKLHLLWNTNRCFYFYSPCLCPAKFNTEHRIYDWIIRILLFIYLLKFLAHRTDFL